MRWPFEGEHTVGWTAFVQPAVLPLLRFLTPMVLRYFAVWWLARRSRRALSKRDFLLIWALVFAALREHHSRRLDLRHRADS